MNYSSSGATKTIFMWTCMISLVSIPSLFSAAKPELLFNAGEPEVVRLIGARPDLLSIWKGELIFNPSRPPSPLQSRLHFEAQVHTRGRRLWVTSDCACAIRCEMAIQTYKVNEACFQGLWRQGWKVKLQGNVYIDALIRGITNILSSSCHLLGVHQ